MLSIRQRTIIQSILGHPEGISGKQLSEQLRVSEKTIRNDLGWINQWLKEAGFRVCASQRNGYFMEEACRRTVSDMLEAQSFSPDIRENQTPMERRFSIMDRVLGHPGNSVDTIAEYLCVSETTIYKDIACLNKALKKEYGFAGLAVRNRRVFFQAGETEIRKLVFRIMESCIVSSGCLMDRCLYDLMRGIVNLQEIYTFCRYVEAYCRSRKLVTSDQVIYMAAWMLFYVNVRREEAFFLEHEEHFCHQDGLADFLKYMNQSLYLELEDCDLEFLYRALEAVGFPKGGEERDGEVRAILSSFYDKVGQQYQISFAENPELLEDFEKDVEYLIRRVRLHSQICCLPGSERENQEPESDGASRIPEQAIQILSDLIFQEYGERLNGFEAKRLSEYIYAAGWKKENELRVLIVYGADKGWYYRVRRWIQEKLNGDVTICGSCPLYLLEEECGRLKPELLVATQPMDVHSRLPQLTFSGPITEAEERRIHAFLEEIIKNK